MDKYNVVQKSNGINGSCKIYRSSGDSDANEHCQNLCPVRPDVDGNDTDVHQQGKDTIMQKAIEIQGASEIDVDFDKELKNLVQKGALLKNEGREVEKLLMNNNPDDGVTGGATLWKLTQGITAFAREQQPERCRELHEISGQLMNRVKIN